MFVASSPDVFYFKDTDRDGRADLKPVVLTGFDVAKRSSQHYVNSPALGLDNWIYLSDGVGGASKVSSPEHLALSRGRPLVRQRGHSYQDGLRPGFVVLRSEPQWASATDRAHIVGRVVG